MNYIVCISQGYQERGNSFQILNIPCLPFVAAGDAYFELKIRRFKAK
jgi:hypothetical protein